MDNANREKLRARLLRYPGATEESVDAELLIYEERESEKTSLIRDRRYSNAMAEYILERKGYPRPPGWHSVFFYPESTRPRNKVVFLIAALAAAAWYFVR